MNCLLCLVGQRRPTEMIWCDNCPTQVCIFHATSETLWDWRITSLSFLCPACKHVKYDAKGSV